MIILKYILIIAIGILTTYLGILISKKYSLRVEELQEIKNGISILETKIRYTLDPLPEVFIDISNIIYNNNPKSYTYKLFELAGDNMEYTNANNSWNEALTVTKLNINKEDIAALKDLGTQLGNTDLEGQLSNIEMVQTLLETRIEDAQIQKKKSSKLYQKLGLTVGIGLMIILY